MFVVYLVRDAVEAHDTETLRIPAWGVDVARGVVVSPDGELIDEEELRRHTRPPAGPPASRQPD